MITLVVEILVSKRAEDLLQVKQFARVPLTTLGVDQLHAAIVHRQAPHPLERLKRDLEAIAIRIIEPVCD
jgi:hypothetical protein